MGKGIVKMIREKYFLLIGLVALLAVAICYPSTCFSELTIERAVKKEVEKRILDKEITIVPQLNKITTGFGKGKAGEFYFVKTVSKIFFQDKNVTVKATDITFQDDGVTFGLWNDSLGGGKIRIFFSEGDSRQLSADEIENALRFSLSFENNQQVVVNTKSKVFHLHTCNHLPEAGESEEMTLSGALSKGNKPCGYCFTRMLYMPDIGIEKQLARQGAAVQRYSNPLVTDHTVQEHIQDVGDLVLKKWPLHLIGYRYYFQVIEGSSPNAMALPGGHIMITSALLNSVENEEELEAVLAHEIAHVERRHVLRSYYMALGQQDAKAVLGAIGAVAAGAAAANSNQSLTAGALGVTLIGMIALDVYYSGYPKEHEREADDLATFYFEQNYMDKKNLENVFRKFEYLNLATVYNPDPASLTHPYLKERIARIWQVTFRKFNDKHFIYTSHGSPPVQVDLLFQSTLEGKSCLSVYISDYYAIERFTSQVNYNGVSILIHDKNGNKRFDLKSANIIRDTWGAYLLLTGYSNEIIGNVEKVSLVFGKITGKSMLDVEDEIHDMKEGVITFQ
ncbi:MAG: M48 family metallopeptidase [Nitrospirae bacterium]|nr:M48 family metallopeptidase [Nitrospirota bacterium]